MVDEYDINGTGVSCFKEFERFRLAYVSTGCFEQADVFAQCFRRDRGFFNEYDLARTP